MIIWNKIYQLLEKNHSLYLLTVIESQGSAPGRRGFKMLVSDDGYLCGSIGGGIMEFNLVNKAKELLNDNSSHTFFIKQVHRGEATASSGMICSGSQTIAFTPLASQNLKTIKACMNSDQVLSISQDGVRLIDEGNEVCVINNENDWFYREKLSKKLTAHIFGAGHVSVPTSELLSKLGFEVMLYDNRKDINTFNDNTNTSNKQVVNYQQVLTSVDIKADDYILLMTHKFTEDKLLLSQLLSIKSYYLGVLGSSNKIKVMFSALLVDGFKQKDIDRVYAPIGLGINSRTTDEIAVSIVAEIIKVKNS